MTPLSVHVHGFEPEQIYQQLKTINEARLKPFVATMVKSGMKSKTFGDLLRAPSPPPSLVQEASDKEDNDQDEALAQKKLAKKKKSVT